MDTTRIAESFRTIGLVMADLEDSILSGWPTSWEWPSELEAQQIEATRNELMMHLVDMDEATAWLMAGNIVARFRRDITA